MYASVDIFNAGTYGELGIACAATLKLIAVVSTCLAVIQFSSGWTGLSVTREG